MRRQAAPRADTAAPWPRSRRSQQSRRSRRSQQSPPSRRRRATRCTRRTMCRSRRRRMWKSTISTRPATHTGAATVRTADRTGMAATAVRRKGCTAGKSTGRRQSRLPRQSPRRRQSPRPRQSLRQSPRRRQSPRPRQSPRQPNRPRPPLLRAQFAPTAKARTSRPTRHLRARCARTARARASRRIRGRPAPEGNTAEAARQSPGNDAAGRHSYLRAIMGSSFDARMAG